MDPLSKHIWRAPGKGRMELLRAMSTSERGSAIPRNKYANLCVTEEELQGMILPVVMDPETGTPTVPFHKQLRWTVGNDRFPNRPIQTLIIADVFNTKGGFSEDTGVIAAPGMQRENEEPLDGRRVFWEPMLKLLTPTKFWENMELYKREYPPVWIATSMVDDWPCTEEPISKPFKIRIFEATEGESEREILFGDEIDPEEEEDGEAEEVEEPEEMDLRKHLDVTLQMIKFSNPKQNGAGVDWFPTVFMHFELWIGEPNSPECVGYTPTVQERLMQEILSPEVWERIKQEIEEEEKLSVDEASARLLDAAGLADHLGSFHDLDPEDVNLPQLIMDSDSLKAALIQAVEEAVGADAGPPLFMRTRAEEREIDMEIDRALEETEDGNGDIEMLDALEAPEEQSTIGGEQQEEELDA